MDKLPSPLQLSLCSLFAMLAVSPAVSAAQNVSPSIIKVPVYAAPLTTKPLSPIVPANHWAYAALDRIWKLGSNNCSIFSRPKTQLYTRYEFSVVVAMVIDANPESSAQRVNGTIREAEITNIMACLKREFAPELTKLQASVKQG